MVAPKMPDVYLPSEAQLGAVADAQIAWCREFTARLEWVQSGVKARRRDVHLTLLPITKNVRAVATQLYRNSRRGVQTVIVAGNEREERFGVTGEKFAQARAAVVAGNNEEEGLPADLRDQSHLNPVDGRNQWKPWSWSRIPRGQLHNVGRNIDDINLGWTLYFQHLNTPSPGSAPPPGVEPKAPRSRVDQHRLLAFALCHGYAFRLSPEVQSAVDAWKVEMGLEPDRRMLGIHVRRGDTASDDLTQTSGRKVLPLEAYLAHADLLCARYDLDAIYLSTDSQAVVERAALLRPKYQFFSLPHDRGFFPRIDLDRIVIEAAALRDPSIVEPIVTSALADLYFLQHADALIGTFNSNFTLLAWLLGVARNGFVMPYLNMTDEEFSLGHANLAYEPFGRAPPRWKLYLLPRLRTAVRTVRGRPLGEWPSLLKQRWKDRDR